MPAVPRLLIAGTHSGVGKTTVAAGLMAAFRRRGLRVAPFKVGPDYLDPGYHRAAAGRDSAPLDPWMLGAEGVCRSFTRLAAGADLALIEGMMGLHDGAAAETDTGSSAHVARLLRAPVVLVIDGSRLARSAGALVLGYRAFDPEVPFAGVIANRVAGEGHAAFLRPAIEQAGLPLLGWLPDAPEPHFPERHLGLINAAENPALDSLLQRLADQLEAHLDLDALLALARQSESLPDLPADLSPAAPRRVRLGLARDAAFSFYYPDNLALLEAAGAELVPFSPLTDAAPPEALDGLYLGGGYPELHAAQLAGNHSMRAALRAQAAGGLPIYAECGGFMYLCRHLTDLHGRAHEMLALLPGETRMEASLQAIGYREVRFRRDTLLGPAGTLARGHEFRHSRYLGPPDAEYAFETGGRHLGLAQGNLLASYVHLHFASNPTLPEAFVNCCAAFRSHPPP